MNRLLTLGALALLAGCASTPTQDGRALRLAPGWWASPRPLAVQRLAGEAQALADEPACLGARLIEVPDVAHALWLETDGPARATLSAAFAAAGVQAYAASDAAARRAPDEVAAGRAALARAQALRAAEPRDAQAAADEARERFAAAGDALLAAEAALFAADAALAAGEPLPALPSPPVVAQRVQAALLEAGAEGLAASDPILEFADRAQHGAALERIAAAVQRGALRPPVDPSALHLARSGLAVRAGEGELALLTADLGLRLAEAEPPGQARELRLAEARLALAQARLLMGQPAAAALEATTVAENAPTLAFQARGESLLGQALWARGQAEAAAEAYARAAQSAQGSADADTLSRAQLNRAAALLTAKADLDQVDACLRPIPGEGREAQTRREVLRVLVGLLRGELTGPLAAERIEAQLDLARGAGAYAVLQRYGDLPQRLNDRARALPR